MDTYISVQVLGHVFGHFTILSPGKVMMMTNSSNKHSKSVLTFQEEQEKKQWDETHLKSKSAPQGKYHCSLWLSCERLLAHCNVSAVIVKEA